MNETNSTKNQNLKLEKNTNFLIISAPFYEEIDRKLRDGAETIIYRPPLQLTSRPAARDDRGARAKDQLWAARARCNRRSYIYYVKL